MKLPNSLINCWKIVCAAFEWQVTQVFALLWVNGEFFIHLIWWVFTFAGVVVGFLFVVTLVAFLIDSEISKRQMQQFFFKYNKLKIELGIRKPII